MEEERHRLAREFHDGPLQALTAMGIRIDLCKELSVQNDPAALQDELTQLKLDFLRSIVEIRDLVAEWRLPSLDGDDLRGAVDSYVREYEGRTGIEVKLNPRDLPNNELDGEQKVAIFRILQEALRNIHWHSGASQVRVEVTTEAGNLQVSIGDDGRGFNLLSATANYPRQGLGLAGMQERAKALGGELYVDSRSGRGTNITLIVPLQGSKE